MKTIEHDNIPAIRELETEAYIYNDRKTVRACRLGLQGLEDLSADLERANEMADDHQAEAEKWESAFERVMVRLEYAISEAHAHGEAKETRWFHDLCDLVEQMQRGPEEVTHFYVPRGDDQ